MDVFPVPLLQLFLQEVVEVEVDDGVVEVLARGQRLVVRLAQTREADHAGTVDGCSVP